MIPLEHTKTQVQVYNKGTHFILYLIYLESREDDGWEKGSDGNQEGLPISSFSLFILYTIGI